MKIVSFLFLILVFSACHTSSHPEKGGEGGINFQSMETWPDSLVLLTTYSGGMINESSSVYISKDSCVVWDNRQSIQNHYRMFATPDQLNQLLVKLRAGNIDALAPKKMNGVIYDAPEYTISINLGSQSRSLSNGPTEQVTSKNPDDFRNCYDIISGFTTGLLAGRQQKCCITIDASVRKSKGILSLIPLSGPPAWSDSASLAKPEVCYSLLPGQYPWQIHLTAQSPAGQTIYLASLNPVIKMGVSDTSYTLKLKNDSTLVLQ